MTDEHRVRYLQEFEAAGDEVGRANVLLNRYDREKRVAAEEWLRERPEARRRVLTSDELYIARSGTQRGPLQGPLGRRPIAQDGPVCLRRSPSWSPVDPSSSCWYGAKLVAFGAQNNSAQLQPLIAPYRTRGEAGHRIRIGERH